LEEISPSRKAVILCLNLELEFYSITIISAIFPKASVNFARKGIFG